VTIICSGPLLSTRSILSCANATHKRKLKGLLMQKFLQAGYWLPFMSPKHQHQSSKWLVKS